MVRSILIATVAAWAALESIRSSRDFCVRSCFVKTLFSNLIKPRTAAQIAGFPMEHGIEPLGL